MTKQLLTVSEASEILRVPSKSVYRWISEGYLPSIKLGKKTIRIDKDELENFLKKGGNTDEN